MKDADFDAENEVERDPIEDASGVTARIAESNIVTRLRHAAHCWRFVLPEFIPSFEMFEAAANEIERLRKQVIEQPITDDLPGMLALQIAVKKGEFPHTMDAHVWAKKWMETIQEHPDIPTDEGTMIGWFANAIMAGWDAATTNTQADLV